MIRKIITIDKEKCIGCSLCVNACHEEAIALVDGKATLLRDDYCDGLGNCLPVCPTNAISFTEREAAEYNVEEVKKNKEQKKQLENSKYQPLESQLEQWPVQIKLVSPNAPFLKDCDLLIAADCTAYAYGNFHNDFIKNKTVLIGCPKLDNEYYSEKLSMIFQYNNITSVTIVRMSVPCCGGIVHATMDGLKASKKDIPVKTVIISPDGTIMN